MQSYVEIPGTLIKNKTEERILGKPLGSIHYQLNRRRLQYNKQDYQTMTCVCAHDMFVGNNFHYLKRLRETGLIKEIRGFINRWRIYFWVRAGSMIMDSDIDENHTFARVMEERCGGR
jgi:peptidase E